ncbi:MAG: retropepsin-like aspartic protease [Bacteroidota bacterium]
MRNRIVRSASINSASFFHVLFSFILLWFSSLSVFSQSEIAVLTTGSEASMVSSEIESELIRVDFDMVSDLIWFKAEIDGEQGYFILDTGAPTLLLNNWDADGGRMITGEAANGAPFSLSEGRVRSFQIGGKEQGVQRALGLDLSGMENRSGQTLHGIMGYEQLRRYELLIDYEQGQFELLTRVQRRGRIEEPLFSIPFRMVDHLPVIRLRVGNKTWHLALDSGAACNLIDEDKLQSIDAYEPTGEQTRLHNLSGSEEITEYIRVSELEFRTHQLVDMVFAPTDFGTALTDEIRIDGLLGQPFFQMYRLSIDYKGRKIHFWKKP